MGQVGFRSWGSGLGLEVAGLTNCCLDFVASQSLANPKP